MPKANRRAATLRAATIRCAVYTRKSHEEGLEQDFNSLDAQRESCEAYIASQKHEGWACLPDLYDDGGISGATMERPALKRLLADVAARRVDTVVVYKVDRLTRSLGDFAKIVEVFDQAGVSFVSVTQQFNTTTSMGRLTLNMLLSFAQFEREVTGERIRDKIAASKKKGLWMGGLPPLGYDVDDRKLVVNAGEAETVRHIYRRYLDLGSVRNLQADLKHDGIVSKRRVDRYGRPTGGKPLARGALYHLLQNRIYRGEIVHKDKSYPGAHDAIVDEPLWQAVQEKLAANRQDRVIGSSAAEPSLLAGLLEDDTGTPMTPTHANKKGTRYRYYVTRDTGRWRVPAADLEGLVAKRLCRFLGSNAELFAAIETIVSDATDRAGLLARGAALSREWAELAPPDKKAILQGLVDCITLKPDRLEIAISPHRIVELLEDSDLRAPGRSTGQPPSGNTSSTLALSLAVRLKRAGIETRMIIDGGDQNARRRTDHSLHRLLAQGHRYREMVLRRGQSISELAAEAGVGRSYFSRILRLGFLSPDAVKTILADGHPLELTARKLGGDSYLPIEWERQKDFLGIR
jgi:site-specific DNA recombinase